MAAGIANSPAMYGLYKAAGMLDAVAGGIALPDIKVMGSGVNLQTTVADLMRVGAMSGGILGSIGTMVAAGGGGNGLEPSTCYFVDVGGNAAINCQCHGVDNDQNDAGKRNGVRQIQHCIPCVISRRSLTCKQKSRLYAKNGHKF